KLTGDIRAFHCKGDSMTGLGIFDGDIAVVRIQEDVENGELAIVVINGNEGTLKKVRKHDDVIILESANPAYPARIFSGKEANQIHIVGKVIEIRRTI
ncbi:LexA family protein, partial [Pectinatus frisingensis]|uniref:LexA family protein n=1 Tax=Pectinatus frisingensis TaxID=865 RepID=UPI002ED8A9C3